MIIRELFRHWTYQVFAPGTLLRNKYNSFKDLLRHDGICLELIADLEEIYYGNQYADWSRIQWICKRLETNTRMLIENLMGMSPARYLNLSEYFQKINFYIQMGCTLPAPAFEPPYVLGLAAAAERADICGGKAANLSRIAALKDIPTLPGFVVTSNAFNYIVEANGLRPCIDRMLRRIRPCRSERIADLSRELQALILTVEIPKPIADDIMAKAKVLAHGGELLAVRSSALSEDGQASSFAGQYESILNVTLDDVLGAYRTVLASKYLPKALTYRILQGLADQETPMAVLVQPMLEATASGLVYTRDPESSTIQGGPVLFAVPGLGDSLMDGRATPLSYRSGSWSASTGNNPTPDPPLSSDKAEVVLGLAMNLESHFSAPQDVEWAMGLRGDVVILQSRPIHTAEEESESSNRPTVDVPEGEEPIFRGGERASSGVGAGAVVHIRNETVEIPPKDSILVVESLNPELAEFVPRLAGVLAMGGSRASHFSSVAREFKIPVLITRNDPFVLFPSGAVVTVDADAGAVYAGDRVKAAAVDTSPSPRRQSTPAMTRLGKILPYVSKLNLTDPQAENFSPEGCKSIHDLVRFCHEKSVAEMFSLVGKGGRGLGKAHKLVTDLPMSMYVLDLDDGLFKSANKKSGTVTPEDFKSAPMWALWWGFSTARTKWDKKLFHVDWEEFDRISSGIFSKDTPILSSYAVLSANYMHVMLRFGYHFSVVDAMCDKDEKNNYINFSFKGGGAAFDNRILRLEFILRVLSKCGFTVHCKGDLLDAKYGRGSETSTQQKLAVLGRLLAETRLMDMKLSSLDDVSEAVRTFFETMNDNGPKLSS